MNQGDPEIDAFVARHSRRMMSSALYHRLKSQIESWDHEERGKAKVVAGAVLGLVVWFALMVAAALLAPGYAGLLLPVGFAAWVIFVMVLIRRHLGARRKVS